MNCIVHIGSGASSGELKPIDAKKWKKLVSVVNIRKSKYVKSTYEHILENFPKELCSNHGYHSSCYKNFTAVQNVTLPEDAAFVESINTRSHRSSTEKTSSTGVLPRICIFCRHVKSSTGEALGSSETRDAEKKIRDIASQSNDTKLLNFIGNYLFGQGQDFAALEAKYHHSCKRKYYNQSRKSKDTKELRISTQAFKKLTLHVKDSVINDNIPELVSSLLQRYTEFYVFCGGSSADMTSYTGQNLCKRLRNKFDESKLTIWAAQSKPNPIVCKYGVTEEEARRLMSIKSDLNKSVIRNCADILRKSITECKKIPLKTDTAENVMLGEVKIPEEVEYFYSKLYDENTNKQKGRRAKRKRRFVESSSADAVFCCSNQHLLPGKQVSLGLTLKSMSGSKRIVQLVNRNGHCASSETLRRIDMGIEESVVSSKGDIVPDGILKQPNLSTGTAFDNFDINLETINGLGTVHHTYGIIYQNIPNDNASNISLTPDTGERNISACSGKRSFRRVEDSDIDLEIEPYFKKPKITHHSFRSTEFYPPETLCTDRNLLWALAKSIFPDAVPSWCGWNSLNFVDQQPQQALGYLKPIPLPPTRTDVVKETLKQSQKIAEECGEDHALVTYDLAVAKIAKQIQDAEQPSFDNIFIMFGSFHIELSFFGSLGKLIEGSGGPFVLSEQDIIAPGSMMKFLKGKMYNRCRRAHILLSGALHGLHFERFLLDEGLDDATKKLLKDWATSPDNTVIPDDLQLLATKYSFYCEDTLAGKRGKTAQFWISYCYFMDSYLLFHHAMKTNDIDLFAYALHDLSKIFFVTNHHNYARWMTRYTLELLNIDKSLKEKLTNGGFSVRRTNNPYSRVGVDMALEQTINAEAKNRLKGIMMFADVNSAVNRWVVTNSMRTQIVNKVLDLAGLSPKDAPTANRETEPTRMKRDAADFKKISESIRDMLNPFDENINKDALFNIKTGKRTSSEAEKYLLNVIEEGEKRRDQFIAECGLDEGRFEKSLQKCPIINFATDSFKKQNKSKKAEQIVELKGTRDLFARLLFLAVKKNMEIEQVLEYPLVPLPPELAHPDGSIRTTPKSSFVDVLDLDTTPPGTVDTIIVDGMFLLRNLVQPLPHNLRGLVRHILIRVLKMTVYRADLVFDTYNSPCLKDITRDMRADGDGEDPDDDVYTFGGGQKTPKNFSTLLKISSFKKEFLRFFYEEVCNPEFVDIIDRKVVYVAVDNTCVRLETDWMDTGELKVSECLELYGDHDEADTRVAFHAYHAEKFDPGNTVIRCNDTNILVIMLSNIHHFVSSSVWLDVGLEHNNSRKYINLKETARNCNYVKALPGVYAISGLDFIPAWARKGKKKPVKVMLTNKKFVDVFTNIGDKELSEDEICIIENYFCCLFGFPKRSSINEARFKHFEKKCKPRSAEKPLDYIKSVDPALFPPCRSVLIEQIKRAWLVSRLYKKAIESEPLRDVTPLDFGYELIEGRIQPKWFGGEQVPLAIEGGKVEEEVETDDEVVNEEDDDSSDESDNNSDEFDESEDEEDDGDHEDETSDDEDEAEDEDEEYGGEN